MLLQVWQGLFPFIALSTLLVFLFLASGLVEGISVETSSKEATKHLPFPNQPTNVVSHSHSSAPHTISPVKLDLAIFRIIQMLLVMSGIETNPGPEIEKCEAGIDALQFSSSATLSEYKETDLEYLEYLERE